MGLLLKYLPLILKFNDVTAATKADYPEGKPFWMSQRFWGIAAGFIGAVLAAFGIKSVVIDPTMFGDVMVAFVIAAIGLVKMGYGIVLGIKGHLDAEKRKTEAAK
jgi:hypothetical protein